nr:AlpA family phage regulatory protein [Ensifer sp. ENS07]
MVNAILISMRDVCTLTSLSRTMVNRLRVAGRFPGAVELGERRVAFVRSEVLAWIEERIAGRAEKEMDDFAS